jgi:hypothetical protein
MERSVQHVPFVGDSICGVEFLHFRASICDAEVFGGNNFITTKSILCWTLQWIKTPQGSLNISKYFSRSVDNFFICMGFMTNKTCVGVAFSCKTLLGWLI